MTISRYLLILLSALFLLAPVQVMAVDEGCPDLKGKEAAAHLEYLLGDRSKLSPQGIIAALRYVGGKRYSQAGPVLVQYLDDHNPDPTAERVLIEAYPAIDALRWFSGR